MNGPTNMVRMDVKSDPISEGIPCGEGCPAPKEIPPKPVGDHTGQIGKHPTFTFDHSFYGTMLSKNSITLPKTPSALCRVFFPAVVRLRMLRMSPGAVLSSGG
jgi:hypothetical protein